MRFHRIVFVALLGLLGVLAVVLVQKTMHPATQITGMQPVQASDYGDLIKAVGPLPENPPTLVHFFFQLVQHVHHRPCSDRGPCGGFSSGGDCHHG